MGRATKIGAWVHCSIDSFSISAPTLHAILAVHQKYSVFIVDDVGLFNVVEMALTTAAIIEAVFVSRT